MQRFQHVFCLATLLSLAALLAVSVVVGAEEPGAKEAEKKTKVSTTANLVAKAPKYIWKEQDVFRFAFEKKIETFREYFVDDKPVINQDGKPKKTSRVSTISGILVLKLDAVTLDGQAAATLSFDDPRVEIPPVFNFDKKGQRLKEDKVLAQKFQLAIEGVLGEILWEVTLNPSGEIKVMRRTPADLERVAAQTLDVDTLPIVFKGVIKNILQNDLGLGSGLRDTNLILCFLENPFHEIKLPPHKEVSSLSDFTPYRMPTFSRVVKDNRSVWDLKRTLIPGIEAGCYFSLKSLNKKEPKVLIKLTGLENHAGSATFDEEQGWLDELEESYSVFQETRVEKDTQYLNQEVRVTHSLKRLRPPIRGTEKKRGQEE